MTDMTSDPRQIRAQNPTVEKAMVGLVTFVLGLLIGGMMTMLPRSDHDGDVRHVSAAPEWAQIGSPAP